jgi:hypothetical protein
MNRHRRKEVQTRQQQIYHSYILQRRSGASKALTPKQDDEEPPVKVQKRNQPDLELQLDLQIQRFPTT